LLDIAAIEQAAEAESEVSLEVMSSQTWVASQKMEGNGLLISSFIVRKLPHQKLKERPMPVRQGRNREADHYPGDGGVLLLRGGIVA
jgi:hypothetical protein